MAVQDMEEEERHGIKLEVKIDMGKRFVGRSCGDRVQHANTSSDL